MSEEKAVYLTKDTGKRKEFSSGAVRDDDGAKTRWDLIFPLGQMWSESPAAILFTSDVRYRKLFKVTDEYLNNSGGGYFPIDVTKELYKIEGRSMPRRLAELMTRGAAKYNARNWELMNSKEELGRATESLTRHALEYMSDEGELDGEDHAAGLMFNLILRERLINFHNISPDTE